LLFGSSTVWLELPNGSSKIANKVRQKIESGIYGKQKITRTINHLATNCLARSNVQILCNYTRSVWYHFADTLQ
jgi:hypothetical protein